MPKPLKKKARDENEAAFASVQHIIQMAEPETAQSFDAQFRAHMATLGRKGGKTSGARRMKMPAEKRSAIALKAATDRWARERSKKRTK